MKTRKITKNELLKLIREAKQDSFQIAEPLTQDSVSQLTSRIKEQLRRKAFLPFVVLADE